MRPQELELPLSLVDPMIAYAVYNYHQFFPAQFICPYRIVGRPSALLPIIRLLIMFIILTFANNAMLRSTMPYKREGLSPSLIL